MKTTRIILAAIVAITVAGGAYWCFARSRNNAETSQTASTRVREGAFQIDLPGKWNATVAKSSAEGGKWIYRSLDAGPKGPDERMVVSIVLTDPMDEKGQRAVLEQYVAWRIKAEKAAAGSGATVIVGAITRSEKEGVFAAQYGGFDAAEDRRFSCLVLVSNNAAGVFSFEAVNVKEAAFEQRARGVLDSALLVKRAAKAGS